jgi:two-component system, OmpR family, sensor histidine kinase KdpD
MPGQRRAPASSGACRAHTYDAAMRDLSARSLKRSAVTAGAAVLALGSATLAVWVLQEWLGVLDASPSYLLAVTGMAVLFGTVPAGATALASVLVYNFFFTHPRFTLIVADSGQLLNLVLLLVVGVVVGQLAAMQRHRAAVAEQRQREAFALFGVSRALATRRDTPHAMRSIVDVLREYAGLDSAWVALGDTPARERSVTDDGAPAPPTPSSYEVLQRGPTEEHARWMRVRPPGARAQNDDGSTTYRVPIQAGAQVFGAIWAQRARPGGDPSREETRLLAAAADQIGQALEQDRLRSEATSAELARRSDAAKTALLDSVSHDLRTPLAAIRAAAGSLAEEGGATRDEALAIDREAERLDRLVGNLLDMSRIEAGNMRTDLEPYALDDLVDASLRRLRPMLAGRSVAVDMPRDLPYVLVDALLMDQVLANLLENAALHAPDAPIRISATVRAGRLQLIVEDGGPGVPPEAMQMVFDKFYRVARPGAGPMRGSGMGLAVVRGLVEAMGGRVSARRSDLGGLAVVVEVAVAPPEPEAA